MKQSGKNRTLDVLQTFLSYLSWGDRLLMLAVLAASIGFIPWLKSGLPGQAAVVHVNNEIFATLPLHREGELTVLGPLGETVVQIKSGKVRVIRDPGPRQLCVRQGWISRAGDTLVCLPNRVVIRIPGTPPYDGLVK